MSHMPCVTICESSIAANAGASQPLLEMTSTMACSSRAASGRIDARSLVRSPLSCMRPKCACSSAAVLTCGSVVRRLSSVTGEWFSTCRSALASPGRAACLSNSVAPATISSSPLSLVFAVRDAAKSSIVVYVME